MKNTWHDEKYIQNFRWINEGRRPVKTQRHIWEKNIKIDLKRTGSNNTIFTIFAGHINVHIL
jgi:hypothetical protein